MSILLSLNSVDYQIGNKQILQQINLSLSENEIVTVVGPNGAGKTTLLLITLGLVKPTSGQVIFSKKTGKLPRIGYVPQTLNRDSTMPISVLEFILLSKKRQSKKKVMQLLVELSLAHLASSFISELSGGEMRRVLFARALLNQPQLLVLDEPTAGVDVAGQEEFYHQLNILRKAYGFSILMVSHDLHLVMSTTDRVVCLNGHICCQGKPEKVINHPNYQSLFIAENTDNRAISELAFYQHDHDHVHHEHS
ncbi:MAG: metal ABC transporter ATP-binding protein [Ostreibacterium sp.]